MNRRISSNALNINYLVIKMYIKYNIVFEIISFGVVSDKYHPTLFEEYSVNYNTRHYLRPL